MRSLRNIRHEECRADATITGICWDAGADEILVATGPTEADPRISLARIVNVKGSARVTHKVFASWDAPSPSPDLLVDSIVGIQYFSDLSTTCLVLAGGDLVIVQELDGGGGGGGVSSPGAAVHVEIVGSIDAGIAAARWSPDEELLVLATKADTVVFMSRSFDVITELPMTAGDLQASKHVSVGWGKKETQFHGKGAKALRDPTIPEKVDQGILSPHDDGRTSLSWRGDGAYVAINSVVAEGRRRVIRVYTREGALDSASEPVDGLEGSLSWRPAGNLIAGVQRLSERIDVVFFERNGLRHGQFTLRFPTADLPADISLEWNGDSTVLAVTFPGVTQLWTIGNYHWYLKQEIRHPSGSPHSHAVWHPERPLRLAVSASEILTHSEWAFHVFRGSVVAPHDYGAVAVVDGKTLKVTPLRTANVPPPMALFEPSFAASVVDVAFTPSNSRMAVLHHRGVDVFSWETKSGRSLAPKMISQTVFPATDGEFLTLRQVLFSGPDQVGVLHVKDGVPQLSAFVPDVAAGKMRLDWTRDVDSASTLLTYAEDGLSVLCAQDHSGRIFRASASGLDLLPVQVENQITSVDLVKQLEHGIRSFGLSRNGHLFADRQQLAKNCTSFVVTSDHLIFTTSNHFLKFVHLAGTEELMVPPDEPETDERCRSIERGARLVTAMPSHLSLVLQMPRGNLETIYPRAMVVPGIRRLIDDKDYARAFAYCRTQRVDMNILHDHRPDQFLSNVGLFLGQLHDVAHIDLFLSALREEDVTQTMYKDTNPKSAPGIATTGPWGTQPRETPSPQPLASKVNAICDAVLRSLRADKSANLQNIITAHVCKDPPAVDDGLLVVAELMQEDETLAEKAVEHICFLVDVNRLYDHALGLYNLDLALLVAQRSQRDPREYLPFVQSLHAMPELRRRFAIDDHLGHREKALAHLRSDDDFEAARDYTVKHGLYRAALGLYRYEEHRACVLTGLFAADLEARSKFREAGVAYESLGRLAEATACYRSAGSSCWRECLFVARRQVPPLGQDAVRELAGALADVLLEAKDYAAAAQIQTEYLYNRGAAIRSLCKGYKFADALLLSASDTASAGGSTGDVLAADVDAGLVDALASTTELLADCKAQLRAQIPRIMELRRKAVEDPLGFYEGDRLGGGGDGDIPDDVSVAASSRLSTSASLFTRYTGKEGSVGTAGTGVSRATHKNRKREEKKRARGRKGTVYEEEYLVNSVRRLVDRIGAVKGEVEALVFGLVRRGMAERARAVEALLAEVVEACRAAIAQIWPGSGAASATTQPGLLPAPSPENAEIPGRSVYQAAPPLLEDFSRLVLLG